METRTAVHPASPRRAPLAVRLRRAARLVATPLQPSHYLELLNPLWATHALWARVEHAQYETADARTLTLRPGRGWQSHRAGQFVTVGATIDGVRHTRPYSISSPPNRADGCIDITVKAIAGGRVSNFLVHQLTLGTHLAIGLPQGEFVQRDTPPRALFITAGSGITPVMSMLRQRTLPDSVHLHYAPRRDDVIFGEEMQRLAAADPRYRVRTICTRESDAGASHFNAAQLEASCPDWRNREVWACGPASMLTAVEAHWAAAQVSPRLHVERFVFAPPPKPNAIGGAVCFARSGRTVDSDGRVPLLHVAEAAGLTPASGCRMGICHTCDTTLLAGCVRDLRNDTLLSAGQKVQLCVCAAAGDVELGL